jgi:hypothetical protein
MLSDLPDFSERVINCLLQPLLEKSFIWLQAAIGNLFMTTLEDFCNISRN